MLGIIIGTACLIGLIKVLRRGPYGYGRHGAWGFGGGACGGGGCGSGWGGRSQRFGGFAGEGQEFGGEGPPWARRAGWGGFGWGGAGSGGVMLRGLFEHLDTTPGQEKVIHEAISELRAEGRHWREELQKSRADIGKAMRAESFDEVVLGELFARHDSAIEALRKATTGALARVHVVLDERQRARLADLIEMGPAAFRRRRSYRDDL